MPALVTRKFSVKGTVQGMFTPDEGTPTAKYIANMRVELWHKGPMDVVFLGEGLTASDGAYNINFELETPSPIVQNGIISDVFVKVYYNTIILTGDIDDGSGESFD